MVRSQGNLQLNYHNLIFHDLVQLIYLLHGSKKPAIPVIKIR